MSGNAAGGSTSAFQSDSLTCAVQQNVSVTLPPFDFSNSHFVTGRSKCELNNLKKKIPLTSVWPVFYSHPFSQNKSLQDCAGVSTYHQRPTATKHLACIPTCWAVPVVFLSSGKDCSQNIVFEVELRALGKATSLWCGLRKLMLEVSSFWKGKYLRNVVLPGNYMQAVCEMGRRIGLDFILQSVFLK